MASKPKSSKSASSKSTSKKPVPSKSASSKSTPSKPASVKSDSAKSVPSKSASAKSPSPIRVGLIGFGNIGAGVVHWLRHNQTLINSRLPRPIALAKIADIDIETDRGVAVDRKILTTDAMEIVNDPSIDIVIELIGGTGVARKFVEAALRAGKHVVTANKALLANHGAELMALAKQKGLVIGAEASVGAGIPILRSMQHALAPNRFTFLAGIVNGTCNYILSEMEQGGKPFKEVLADAQRLGYAEPDPTFDIEGTDSAHKLAILASLAFGQDIRVGDIATQGISRVKPEHLEWAAAAGFRIKLLAAARGNATGGGVDAWVSPTLVRAGGQLGSVMGPFNAVLFDGEPIGQTLAYGRGAGKESTSSGILSDVMAIAAAIDQGGLMREHVLDWPLGKKNRIPADLSEAEFVLCLEAGDGRRGMSGVFSAIETAALPIVRVETRRFSDPVKGIDGSGLLFWIETLRTQAGRIRQTVEALTQSGLLRDRPQVLRIEREY